MSPIFVRPVREQFEHDRLIRFLQTKYKRRAPVVSIVFEKWKTLRMANAAADAFEDKFWSGGGLDELYEQEGAKPSHPMAAVFGAAMGEWRRSARVVGADVARSAVGQRVDRDP